MNTVGIPPHTCYGLTALSFCKKHVWSTQPLGCAVVFFRHPSTYFVCKVNTFFSPVWVLPHPFKSCQSTNRCSEVVFLHAVRWFYQWQSYVIVWVVLRGASDISGSGIPTVQALRKQQCSYNFNHGQLLHALQRILCINVNQVLV